MKYRNDYTCYRCKTEMQKQNTQTFVNHLSSNAYTVISRIRRDYKMSYHKYYWYI